MTKFCPSCGEELVDGARFCKSCGVSVEDYNAEPKRPEMPKVEEKSYAAYFIIGYVVALLSPILGIFAALYLTSVKAPRKVKIHCLFIILVSIVVYLIRH